MVDNNDWIGKFSFTEWLRDVGKYITINYMMAKESVKARLSTEQGISYTEFSYMTMQAYDFAYLSKEFDCTVQVGGNDQWGNITAGIEMARKIHQNKVYGLTCPLLTTSTGEKFGKSAGNAVWLSPYKTSPYKFYQYWLQTTDEDVEKFLKIFTFLDLDLIAKIVLEHKENPGKRIAQYKLAEEITKIVHGEEQLARAQKSSCVLFGGDLKYLKLDEIRDVFSDVPSTILERAKIEVQPSFSELVLHIGIVSSKSEARRLINQGGLYMNNKRIKDMDLLVNQENLLRRSILIIRKGKKQYHLIEFL
jgi:tyrosyl-tRNA synthetase